MKFYKAVLVVATVLTGLAAGGYVTFSYFVLPGIHRLNDRDFIVSYQAADSNFHVNPANIQKEENAIPAFVYTLLPYFLAAITIAASMVLGFSHLSGTGKLVLTAAFVLYTFFGLGITLVGNVPRNTKIQSHIVDSMSESEISAARQAFEPGWMRYTHVRSVASTAAVGLLAVMLINPKSFTRLEASKK